MIFFSFLNNGGPIFKNSSENMLHCFPCFKKHLLEKQMAKVNGEERIKEIGELFMLFFFFFIYSFIYFIITFHSIFHPYIILFLALSSFFHLFNIHFSLSAYCIVEIKESTLECLY